jgi:hypothetical protein
MKKVSKLLILLMTSSGSATLILLLLASIDEIVNDVFTKKSKKIILEFVLKLNKILPLRSILFEAISRRATILLVMLLITSENNFVLNNTRVCLNMR